ncbi:MAG: type II secretion system protein [Planctomycetota bacterium]|nr:type II secretion system protein [Planctomycetota bacterium]
MRSNGARGFTLAELLIVIVIIGLLATLLYPAAYRAFETSELLGCTERLYYIGQAWHVRASEARVRSQQIEPLQVAYWKQQLRPYLEETSDQLMCPVASLGAGTPTGWDAVDPWDRARQQADSGGGVGGRTGSFISEEDIVERPSTENLKVEVWLRPGSDFRGVQQNNLIYIMDCEEGQWARKENVTEDSYELVFEDSWNTTWNDLRMRFTEHEDGSLEITYLEEHTGGNCYNLVDVTNGKTLLCGMGDGNAHHGWAKLSYGSSVTIEAEDVDQPELTDDENPEFTTGPSGAGGSGTGAALRGTYGMNSIANFREAIEGHVILCLDYKKTVARGPTDSLPDWWHKEGWQTDEGLPVFARHFGKINVLFSDGRVELMDPWEIDPSGPVSVNRWWDPMADLE